jgi:hypothetical protein
LQEQPAFDKKQFVMKHYIKNHTAKLDAEQSDIFRKNIEGATVPPWKAQGPSVVSYMFPFTSILLLSM